MYRYVKSEEINGIIGMGGEDSWDGSSAISSLVNTSLRGRS